MNTKQNNDQQSSNAKVEEIVAESVSEPFEANDAIEQFINSAPIFMFMNGNSDKPNCSHSANAVAILNKLNMGYTTFNVLNNKKIKEGVRAYSKYGDYPQVFINGEFLGGYERLFDLFQSGQLRGMI